MLEKLHEGHQSVVKCRLRAKSSVWWPGLSKQLEELVTNCTACARERHIHGELMILSESRLRPWQKVATDMCVLQVAYLPIRWGLLFELRRNRQTGYCRFFRCHYPFELDLREAWHPGDSCFGQCQQYAAQEFVKFAEDQGFTHITSSPRSP